ncbi:AAA family ATPase [Nannocystaceae bacterium ST9]
MSSLTLRAQAFGPLAKVEWTIPPGVSAIVGPNRVGKSTLLALPEFLRIAFLENLNDAVRAIFDGPAYLRNFGMSTLDTCHVGISSDDSTWDVDIALAGGAVAQYCAESLRWRSEVVLTRKFGSSTGECKGRAVSIGTELLPVVCTEHGMRVMGGEFYNILLGMESEHEALLPFARHAVLAGGQLVADTYQFLTYGTYRYEIQHLVKFGSVHTDGIQLERAGANAFPLLRNWRDNGDTEARFEFVVSTLREAFPHVNRVDFEQAGQTVTMAIRDRRWPDRKVPISRESTGFVTALLQLCAVASTPKNGLVTIDELETSLHPHAIRVLIEAFRRWADEHDLRIVLATQSETVLDQFHDDPGKIYVIEPGQDTSPRSLTDLFDGDYLNQFSLGDLFSHLEFGSNREPTSP